MSRVMTRTKQTRKPKTRRDGDTYAVTASFCTVHALVGKNGTSQPLSVPASQLYSYDSWGTPTADATGHVPPAFHFSWQRYGSIVMDGSGDRARFANSQSS